MQNSVQIHCKVQVQNFARYTKSILPCTSILMYLMEMAVREVDNLGYLQRTRRIVLNQPVKHAEKIE